MKQAFTVVSAVLALGVAGCSTPTRAPDFAQGDAGHRLVRISFRGQNTTYKMRINEGPVRSFADTSFTNHMIAFRFEYGDIVVWEAVRDEHGKELSWPPGVSLWWIGQLERVRASHYCINSDNIKDFFSTPLYHWTAPFAKPRPLPDALFFCNGQKLGQGVSGFCAMLDSYLAHRASDTPFTLAPRIQNEADDMEDLDQMCRWLRESGAEAKYGGIYPSGITDFAREMDSP
ncbi:MAG TPA: hypothetical protein VJA21_19990 [Verrucomicrobiae bacterium]